VLSDYFFENFPEKRYLTNLIGAFFILVSLLTVGFIEEDLKRSEKDAEFRFEKIENIQNEKLQEDKECLIGSSSI
jgi:hypothetical protein